MATIANYFEQAQLSMAAYALNLLPGMSGSNLTSDYINGLRVAGMSQKQAEEFANAYSVIDQYSDPDSGFSATIFSDPSGRYYFAIRGSEFNNLDDVLDDWFGTNVGDVGLDGIAVKQGLALFN